jgi:TRAP-type C4-dicarboxylate transport system permease small subunit
MRTFLGGAGAALYRICFASGSLLVLAMTFVVIANVVARYCFNFGLSWAEEIARYLMVWLAMVGAAMAVRSGTHFRMEFLEHIVGPGTRRLLRGIWLAAIAGLALLLLYQGVILVGLTAHQLATASQLPMSAVYVSLPLAGAIMLAFVVEAAICGPPERR